MKFEFAGQTWNTDKPVFIAGHIMRDYYWKKSWSPYYKNGTSHEYFYKMYGVTCKKMWIKEISFENKDGLNCVKDIKFGLPHGEDWSLRFSNSFASHKRETAVTAFLSSLNPKEKEKAQ